ncbi:MAG: vWA domain-containing protein [Marivibrio sp.]|uniref:vWA domain-containing protein n=1 Tax=Marivibrio sp. TaxID=2039719 RepID=UPI0032EF7BCA
MRRSSAALLLALALTLAAASGRPALAQGSSDRTAVEAGRCGSVDLVFAIDKTYSIGRAIGEAKAEARRLLDLVEKVSDGDFRLGLVSFRDYIDVDLDLTPPGEGDAAATAFRRALFAIRAEGGKGGPEASDEALATAVDGIAAGGDRPQQGDFSGDWRARSRILVLITDHLPGGFDDAFRAGEDDANARAVASRALARGIRISAIYIPTTGDRPTPDPLKAEILRSYALLTGGLFLQIERSGQGAAEAVAEIIAACGAKTVS